MLGNFQYHLESVVHVDSVVVQQYIHNRTLHDGHDSKYITPNQRDPKKLFLAPKKSLLPYI